MQLALADPNVDALYLLSDGRPDRGHNQLLEDVEALLSSRTGVVVHTISFNCTDVEANFFLERLACSHGGGFQYHLNMEGLDAEALFNKGTLDLLGPPPRSTDERCNELLKEILFAQEELRKVNQLYLECAEYATLPVPPSKGYESPLPDYMRLQPTSTGLVPAHPHEHFVATQNRPAWNKSTVTSPGHLNFSRDGQPVLGSSHSYRPHSRTSSTPRPSSSLRSAPKLTIMAATGSVAPPSPLDRPSSAHRESPWRSPIVPSSPTRSAVVKEAVISSSAKVKLDRVKMTVFLRKYIYIYRH